MSLWHRHRPMRTNTRVMIEAEYGKDNLPEGIKPVRSRGWKAVCRCGALLLVHAAPERLAEPWTEIETSPLS